ncbi:hypothetical protein DLAC_08740 [Tieghemostelium lacteum]|uniref:Transmembrane protein n=1 Tax=Tieghemostelium lacteum TaxID=361077 RepID=A0A151Z856_TIELA|nr:hypothetical protein DLAC_08740 [Tieghemostelium lacteum]|eukprot:KYQ90149.1 hypothetical protein DLAC_08740 [Tieghemostelium lacteum]
MANYNQRDINHSHLLENNRISYSQSKFNIINKHYSNNNCQLDKSMDRNLDFEGGGKESVFFQEIPIPIVGESSVDQKSISTPIGYNVNSYQPYGGASGGGATFGLQDKIFVINNISGPVVKIERHNFTNTYQFILKGIAVPLITTFLITLIPIQHLANGFLENWVYSLIYIPCVTVSVSLFHIGWARSFIKGYNYHYIPLGVHVFLVALTYSLISEYYQGFPPKIYIAISIAQGFFVLPLLIYLRSPERFKKNFTISFLRFWIFVFLATCAVIVSIAFVVAIQHIPLQLLIGFIYYFLIFLFNQLLVHMTRNFTSIGTHNIICYWIETLSELCFCLMYIKINLLNFSILIAVKNIALVRYPLFLTERYWVWRCNIKEHYESLKKGKSWFESTNLFDKVFYGFIGLFFPISMERDEHKTRVVDRLFFTLLWYVKLINIIIQNIY